MKPERIAIFISDLHLTLTQPSCRADKDWMEVQAGYLAQVKKLAKTGTPEEIPVICAGDVFDRWNTPPELINFALEHLPDGMISVPGQHDLPNHRMDQKHRSGYGVLVEAGKIVDLHYKLLSKGNGPCLFGFGWEEEIEEVSKPTWDDRICVAVIHRYCWEGKAKYPDAPTEANVSAFKQVLKGYDIAVFGDNHKSFLTKLGKCQVLNCGGFIRRKSDEIDYTPSIGVLYADGTLKRRKLDTSKDVFHTQDKEREELPLDMREFVEGLRELGEQGLNFKEAVINHLKHEDLEQGVKDMVLEALETIE